MTQLRRLRPYSVAVLLVVIAAGVRVWPLGGLGTRLAWLTFYPAVMVAALIGGLWAGILATALACLVVLLAGPALASSFIRDGGDWIGLVVFVGSGLLISGIAEWARRANDRAAAAAEALRELNVELERRAAGLEAANKELEAFSYSVSHDLRAPVRAVDGFARILLEEDAEDLKPEARRRLVLVRESSRQMGELIDDLLAFARLGRQAMHTSLVSTTDLVHQALDDERPELERRAVEIRIGDLPACRADPILLKQVYVNLLSNALKFTRGRDQPIIEVGCRDEDGERVFFVKDNGVGFDMQYAPKLFQVFQRLHRAEDYEGTGVGLAIVQRVIHRHGGRVWAEAKPDEGATFSFVLAEGGLGD